jgi:hypothetical protein
LRGLKADQLRIEQGQARLHGDGADLLVEALAGNELNVTLR